MAAEGVELPEMLDVWEAPDSQPRTQDEWDYYFPVGSQPIPGSIRLMEFPKEPSALVTGSADHCDHKDLQEVHDISDDEEQAD